MGKKIGVYKSKSGQTAARLTSDQIGLSIELYGYHMFAWHHIRTIGMCDPSVCAMDLERYIEDLLEEEDKVIQDFSGDLWVIPKDDL